MVSTRIYCLGCPFMWQNVDLFRKTPKITRFARLLLGAQRTLHPPHHPICWGHMGVKMFLLAPTQSCEIQANSIFLRNVFSLSLPIDLPERLLGTFRKVPGYSSWASHLWALRSHIQQQASSPLQHRFTLKNDRLAINGIQASRNLPAKFRKSTYMFWTEESLRLDLLTHLAILPHFDLHKLLWRLPPTRCV